MTDRVTEVTDPVPGQGPNREAITKRCKHHRWSRPISNKIRAHLVLAVPVASRRTTGHLDGFGGVVA